MSLSLPLLVELGTEELPVKALPGLGQAFVENVCAGLDKRGIGYDPDRARALYGPRRLAMTLAAVASEQPAQHSERRGPAVSAGYTADGTPSKALLGFAAGCGVDLNQLRTLETEKGAWFVHRETRPGAATAALLPEIVCEAVAALPIIRPMRWGDHEFAFTRPLHWLVLLLGDAVIDAKLFGISSNRMSRGHRFHHPKPVWIGTAEDYVEALRQAKVLADPDQRRAAIIAEVETAARQAGGTAHIDPGLLEEVNCLVEWPKAILCGFEPEFLSVPSEALIAAMQTHQKFFPVLDDNGQLSAHFVGVANIDSQQPGQIRKGYERVIRPRFADARFFYEEDLKQGLAAMTAGLAEVTYQQKLGSIADKVARVVKLAEAVAAETGVDPGLARRVAELGKSDLQSRLVGEFPELQGIAGRYYAAAGGEPAEVADAIAQAYRPRFSGDTIAASKLGQVVAVAERLDTLAGGFVAGLKPTGNKDPFALRRVALGLARTLIEAGIELDLHRQLRTAVELNGGDDSEVLQVYDFIVDRLRGYFSDQDIPGAHFEAVAAARPASLHDLGRRLEAIATFARLPEAEALAAANKRIGNILKKANVEIPDKVVRSRLLEEAEIALAESVEAAIRETDGPLADGDYVAVLTRLAWLRQPVDSFFDAVMVMAEDPALRENRLALLKRLADRFHAVADIGKISENA